MRYLSPLRGSKERRIHLERALIGQHLESPITKEEMLVGDSCDGKHTPFQILPWVIHLRFQDAR